MPGSSLCALWRAFHREVAYADAVFFAFGLLVVSSILLGSLLAGMGCAVATVRCLRKRRYAAALCLLLPALGSLSLFAFTAVRCVRAMAPDTGRDDPARVSRSVTAQELVGSWGEGGEAITFHDDGTARTADGALWRWRQSHRNAFVMSLVGAKPQPERCWIGLRQADEMLLFAVDGCFDESRGWSPGAVLRRNP